MRDTKMRHEENAGLENAEMEKWRTRHKTAVPENARKCEKSEYGKRTDNSNIA